MRTRISYFLTNWLFWFLLFLFFKVLFLLVYHHQSGALPFTEILQIFWYGLPMDISASLYFSLIPVLLLISSIYFNKKYLIKIFRFYTILAILFTVFLAVADAEVYSFWGFRLDTSPLMYINTPKEMIASVNSWVVIRDVSAILLLTVWAYYMFRKISSYFEFNLEKGNWHEVFAWIFIVGLLIIPIRGGLSLAPLNTGSTYFSKNTFANHATTNIAWNIGYSLNESKKIENNYRFFDETTANKIMRQLLARDDQNAVEILSEPRPNILFIVMESLTAKVVEPVGGMAGITPNLNKLIKEGVLFDHFYASGMHSDRGLVSDISGFPSMPYTSIMKYPERSQHLPFIVKDLKTCGYHTSYYYGGNIDFASMRSYMINAGFDSIISEEQFPSSKREVKWGVNDSIMFDQLSNDLGTMHSPFYTMYFTLSCHDPFDVPYKLRPARTEEEKFLNATMWVDKCLGAFIDRSKHSSWWKHTLVIISADHGSALPWHDKNYESRRYHIPILFTGGAVKLKDTVFHAYCSQTDLPYSLLKQLHIEPAKPYFFSHNMFSVEKGFALYIFNNGFGFVSDSSDMAFDCNSKKTIYSQTGKNSLTVNAGKAYMQEVYTRFLSTKK